MPTSSVVDVELERGSQGRKQSAVQQPSPRSRKKIWIDLDNSPHVPFFSPIIKELEGQGVAVTVTARDAFQVSELVKLHGLPCKCIGRHYGKHTLLKAMGLGIRTLQLVGIAMRERPDLAVAHCSRAQLMACKVLGIPSLWISDYEFAKGLPLFNPDWLMLPEVISSDAVAFDKGHILHYPGIKEDVYVPAFRPDPSIRADLKLNAEDFLVTVRPPATEAHYHTRLSDELFCSTMEFLAAQAKLKVVMLPRNDRQEAQIRQAWPQLFEAGKILVPTHALDGLNLIWHSDLVISGGGTMNREAAALGVPVYSIFGGTIGAVDKYLASVGRLTLLNTPDDVRTKIQLVRRNTDAPPEVGESAALQAVVENILAVAQSEVRQ